MAFLKKCLFLACIFFFINYVSGKRGDSCKKDSCLNGGTCVNAKGVGTCTCAVGFGGPACEIEYCQQNPCENDGTCVPATGGRTCTCAAGFGGTNCEITCDVGFGGPDCKTNFCDPNPCKNGDCVPATGGRTCSCYDGFGGPDCDITCDFGFGGPDCKTNFCDPNPCKNGDCVPATGGRTCSCDDGFFGPDCDKIKKTISGFDDISAFFVFKIEDRATSISTIIIDDICVLDSIVVQVDISHTRIGDLRVTLISPDGTRIVLHQYSGGDADDLKVFYPPTSSVGDLSSLKGKSITGNWKLEVYDNVNDNTGVFNSWGFTITCFV